MNNNKISNAICIGFINFISFGAALFLFENSYEIKKAIKNKFFGEPKVPDFKSDYDDYDDDDDSGKDVDDIYEIEIPDSDFYGEDIYK